MQLFLVIYRKNSLKRDENVLLVFVALMLSNILGQIQVFTTTKNAEFPIVEDKMWNKNWIILWSHALIDLYSR